MLRTYSFVPALLAGFLLTSCCELGCSMACSSAHQKRVDDCTATCPAYDPDARASCRAACESEAYQLDRACEDGCTCEDTR
jgi:hypothetical protein